MVNVREQPYVSLEETLFWVAYRVTPARRESVISGGDREPETIQTTEYDVAPTKENLAAFNDAARDLRRALHRGTVKAYDPASGKAIEAREWFWDERSGPEEDVVLGRAQDAHCQILRADMKIAWPRDRTCEDWIRRLAAKYDSEKGSGNQPRKPNRDTLMGEALRKFTGLSQRNFLFAWKRAAHEDWTKPGRRPKPIQD